MTGGGAPPRAPVNVWTFSPSADDEADGVAELGPVFAVPADVDEAAVVSDEMLAAALHSFSCASHWPTPPASFPLLAASAHALC